MKLGNDEDNDICVFVTLAKSQQELIAPVLLHEPNPLFSLFSKIRSAHEWGSWNHQNITVFFYGTRMILFPALSAVVSYLGSFRRSGQPILEWLCRFE